MESAMRAANDSIHSNNAYRFDGRKAMLGYALNRMCYSFNNADNRKRFKAFPEAYCKRYGLSREQIFAVTDMDFIRLMALGGNPYYLAKLAAIYGMSLDEFTAPEGASQCDRKQVMLCPYCRHSVMRVS
jgi:protocatechuate 4,5-dioxygenase alpha chain